MPTPFQNAVTEAEAEAARRNHACEPRPRVPASSRRDSRGVVRVVDRSAYLAKVLRRSGRDARHDLATCGECGRTWDDGISTGWTPTPSGRCPFEGLRRLPGFRP